MNVRTLKSSVIFALGIALSPLAHASTDRPILESRYFGKTQVAIETGELKTRQVGLLTQLVPNEIGSYYAVVSEYMNPFHEDNFISDFFRPGKRKLFSKKRNGYLRELYQWVTLVKLVPINNQLDYNVFPVEVKDGKVQVSGSAIGLGHADLDRGDFELNFEINQQVKNYRLTRQHRFPLKSTWHTEFSAGPYNPGYKDPSAVILTLENDADPVTRRSTAKFNVNQLKGKSITIQGETYMNHLGAGIYTFTPKENAASAAGLSQVTGKIGVFVDIYDASPIMNTVEFILIDPKNPKNSQMYFEEYSNDIETKQI